MRILYFYSLKFSRNIREMFILGFYVQKKKSRENTAELQQSENKNAQITT